MNHFAGNCKFTLSTIVDNHNCKNRPVSYILEKYTLFIIFELWKPETHDITIKIYRFAQNALVDIHQNFIFLSHSAYRKKGGLICSDRPKCRVFATWQTQLLFQHIVIRKAINADHQTIIIVQYTAITSQDRSSFSIKSCMELSMTSQKYRVVCLSIPII